MANFDVRGTALALHTDLKALDDYAKSPAVARALVGVAREKLAEISAHLDRTEIDLALIPPRGDKIEADTDQTV